MKQIIWFRILFYKPDILKKQQMQIEQWDFQHIDQREHGIPDKLI